MFYMILILIKFSFPEMLFFMKKCFLFLYLLTHPMFFLQFHYYLPPLSILLTFLLSFQPLIKHLAHPQIILIPLTFLVSVQPLTIHLVHPQIIPNLYSINTLNQLDNLLDFATNFLTLQIFTITLRWFHVGLLISLMVIVLIPYHMFLVIIIYILLIKNCLYITTVSEPKTFH